MYRLQFILLLVGGGIVGQVVLGVGEFVVNRVYDWWIAEEARRAEEAARQNRSRLAGTIVAVTVPSVAVWRYGGLMPGLSAIGSIVGFIPGLSTIGSIVGKIPGFSTIGSIVGKIPGFSTGQTHQKNYLDNMLNYTIQ